MATRKAVSRNRTNKADLLEGRDAVEAAIYELQICESVLYVARKAFTAPDFHPREDMRLNAYSTLTVVQDRLKALMARMGVNTIFAKVPSKQSSGTPGGIGIEIHNLDQLIDLLIQQTGSNGCPEAPAILTVLHAEVESTLHYAECLQREAA